VKGVLTPAQGVDFPHVARIASGRVRSLDDAAGILVGLGILVMVALAFLVVWPVVALAIELVLVLIGVIVTVAGRVVLRRPWTVVASARGGRDHRHVWHVKGWRASGTLVDEAAEALRLGRTVPERALTTGTPPAALPRVGQKVEVTPTQWESDSACHRRG